MLNEKLDSLVRELNDESQAIVVPEGSSQAALPGPGGKDNSKGGSFNPSPMPRIFKSKEQLMLRANSLKKALRQIIEQAEKGERALGSRREVLRGEQMLLRGIRWAMTVLGHFTSDTCLQALSSLSVPGSGWEGQYPVTWWGV